MGGFIWRLRMGMKYGWSPEKTKAAEILKDSLTTQGIDQWWVAKRTDTSRAFGLATSAVSWPARPQKYFRTECISDDRSA